MVLDIKLLLTDADQLKENQRKRFKSPKIVDELSEFYTKYRELTYTITQLNKEFNLIQKTICTKQKIEQDIKEEVKLSKELDQKIKEAKEIQSKYKQLLNENFTKLSNILHETVLIAKNEDSNPTIKVWGDITNKPYKHMKLIEKLDLVDIKRGAKVVGNRGYFLKNMGVRLNMALIQYSLDFLQEKGFTLLQTPFMMNSDMMSMTAQLEQFDEELYKVSAGNDVKYLIATSEQPISAYHQNETLEKRDLPLMYCGYSTCFRKEAGSSSDVKGIFRVHQFEKIEQFVITEVDKSWEMHDKMLTISEEFYQTLGIPYRVVSIVSGALNNAAAKKYDLEGWFPGLNKYRELVSCSNCTDYQSRALNIKYNSNGFKFPHMLNSTLCATERTICAIIENYQTDDGLEIPEILQKYVGTNFIKYV